MQENRLFKKFLTTFAGFVLLPFLIIVIALLVYTNRLQLKNDIAQNTQLAAQTVSAVSQQTELAKSISQSILHNQNLLNFFDKEYTTSPDLSYYHTTVHDFVTATNGVSDVTLRIYLENGSIPMGFGIFYPMRYIDRTDAFRSFYASEDESIWLAGTFDEELPAFVRSGSSNTFHRLEKIRVGSATLGVVETIIPKQSFVVTAEVRLEPLVANRCCIYNYSNRPLSEKDIQTATVSPGVSYNYRLVYSHHELTDSPFDIVVISSRNQIPAVNIIMVLLFLVAFFVMLAGFFSYNRRMVQDLHYCLDGMAVAIENDFEMPAQFGSFSTAEVSKRRDEISTLAQRIAYLLRQIRDLLDQKVQKETAAKEAVLLALQHQINPHFLYNTMEVFSSRMELAGLYEESGAITAFCHMLRYNMNTKDFLATLGEEVSQVKDYVAIQKIRDIPFEITFDISQELLRERTIRFLLEPFIENSFKYRGTASPLRILVAAKDLGPQIEISISNNGDPFSPERVAELNERFQNSPVSVQSGGNRIGLSNINSRLKLFYGEGHYIQVSCDGTAITFRFLIERRPSAEERR